MTWRAKRLIGQLIIMPSSALMTLGVVIYVYIRVGAPTRFGDMAVTVGAGARSGWPPG